MDVSRPYAAVTGGGLEGEVLAVMTRTSRPLSGRQVARMVTHGSDRGVRRALDRLAEQGLIEMFAAPPAHLYSLNRDHIAAPVAEALVGLRDELHNRIRAAVSEWEVRPVHVSLFGSAARGDGGPESDIDIFVVRPSGIDAEDERWRAQLEQLAEHVRRWTGNHAGLAEVGEGDVAGLVRKKAPVLDELRRDAITLAGPDVASLLKPKKVRR